MIQVTVFKDLEAISQAAAALCLERGRAAIGERGLFSLVLCGGHTPWRTYQLLAESDLDWSKVRIFWGDDRYVPPDDPESNEGQTRKDFLDKVSVPAINVHPIYFEGGPEAAAARYDAVVSGFLADHRFDLCIQGMGADGHTASLFPGAEATWRANRYVVHTLSPVGVRDRISLTLKAFEKARTQVYLVHGADKRDPLKRVLAGENLPSTAVANASPETLFFVDEEAARS